MYSPCSWGWQVFSEINRGGRTGENMPAQKCTDSDEEYINNGYYHKPAENKVIMIQTEPLATYENSGMLPSRQTTYNPNMNIPGFATGYQQYQNPSQDFTTQYLPPEISQQGGVATSPSGTSSWPGGFGTTRLEEWTHQYQPHASAYPPQQGSPSYSAGYHHAGMPTNISSLAGPRTYTPGDPQNQSPGSAVGLHPGMDQSPSPQSVAGAQGTSNNATRQNSREPWTWMKKQPFTNPAPNSGKTRTKDKYRIVYSEFQKVELEKEYLYSKYITIQRKAELARSIQLSERQVKIWFQNRRAKERKNKRKREEAAMSTSGDMSDGKDNLQHIKAEASDVPSQIKAEAEMYSAHHAVPQH